MATNLADEILAMVLAPSLSIPDDRFTCRDFDSFGRNDNVSSSTVLTVCKRWLRIATPLLYEVIILRSTGQAHALADALKQNPGFGSYVKKVRLEGAYSRLLEIFKRCVNLHSLLFTLPDITSGDNVYSLCRTLPIINPTRVIFIDTQHRDYTGGSANKRNVFSALCESIPKWSKLRVFYFPYAQDPSGGSPFALISGRRRNVLADILKDSSSLEEIHSETPRWWDSAWSSLSSNNRIRFYFDMEPETDMEKYGHFLNAIAGNHELKEAIEFTTRAPLDTPLNMRAEALDKPLFSPLALADAAVCEKIWSRILECVFFSDLPDDKDFAILMRNNDTIQIFNMIRRYNRLSLVCKQWHLIIQRIFIHAPLITCFEAFDALTERVMRHPTLGSQIHILCLDLFPREVLDYQARYNTTLCNILPHLPRLRYFIGSRNGVISWEAFSELGNTAGNSLLRIWHLNIELCGPLFEVFSSFKCLEELEISAPPSYQNTGYVVDYGCLATIQSITFACTIEFSSEVQVFSSLHFPLLRAVVFSKVTSDELTFLISNGKNILELDVSMVPYDLLDEDVDLLLQCSSLKTLFLGHHLCCPKFLEISIGNDTLEHIVVSAEVGYPDSKHTAQEIDELFSKVPFERLPRLSSFQFMSYKWPIRHHDIAKDHLVKCALSIKERTGIDVLDKSGKPFRPRVQRRSKP